jgi:hypothetical protein
MAFETLVRGILSGKSISAYLTFREARETPNGMRELFLDELNPWPAAFRPRAPLVAGRH